jgi:rubrerythrin
MTDEALVQESPGEGLRPCDFCGIPVGIDSIDERDCPVCGERDEL